MAIGSATPEVSLAGNTVWGFGGGMGQLRGFWDFLLVATSGGSFDPRVLTASEKGGHSAGGVPSPLKNVSQNVLRRIQSCLRHPLFVPLGHLCQFPKLASSHALPSSNCLSVYAGCCWGGYLPSFWW